jgi:hypothetical protein
MKIFDYKDFKLSIAVPEVLLIPEFKEIWEKDKTKDKQYSFKVFTYVFLMYDWKSVFINYDKEEKHNESFLASGLKESDLEKKEIVDLCLKYESIMNNDLTIVVINAMKESIHQFKQYFKEINFTEKVESGARKGSLVYSVSDYMRTMKDADQIFDTIDKLEEKLKEKLSNSETSSRGSNSVGYFNQ